VRGWSLVIHFLVLWAALLGLAVLVIVSHVPSVIVQ